MGTKPEKLLSRRAAAAYVNEKYGRPCSVGLLNKLAVKGSGPAFRRMGRFCLYEPAELDAWALAQLSAPVRSTSEPARPAADFT